MNLNRLIKDSKKLTLAGALALPTYGCDENGSIIDSTKRYLTSVQLNNSFEFTEEALSGDDDSVGFAFYNAEEPFNKTYFPNAGHYDAETMTITIHENDSFKNRYGQGMKVNDFIILPDSRMTGDHNVWFYNICDNGKYFGDAFNDIMDEYDGVMVQDVPTYRIYVPTNIPYTGEFETDVPFNIRDIENCGY